MLFNRKNKRKKTNDSLGKKRASTTGGIAFGSINEEYVNSEEQLELKARDELAVIPPISGG